VLQKVFALVTPVMHIDLRMVDLSDFVIASCPTNLYSVGTPHEIVVARQQRKPVLVVSPPVRYPIWRDLEARAATDKSLAVLVAAAKQEVVAIENASGTPSQWYMTLVGSEAFFDGFGWSAYQSPFRWRANYLDAREHPAPVRPLLPYLDAIRTGVRPQRWDAKSRSFRDNDDWLLLERRSRSGGA
jgi:hypothetical protein